MSTRLLSLLTLAALVGCTPKPENTDVDEDGYTADVDCADWNAEVHPEADEVCDGVDNDCDGEIDEGDAVDAQTWYADADDDSYGYDGEAITACEAPEGYVDRGEDCDDTSSDVYPGAREDDCTDPVDYNCDGSVGYADADADGWAACEDCDDSEATVNPDADEVCNDVDDDCDSSVDEDAVDAPTWYLDSDGDGHGTVRYTRKECDKPDGWVADDTDCDDGWFAAHPGASEVCDDHDNDCDGTVDEPDALDAVTWYADDDGDGYGDPDASSTQCEQPSSYVVNDDDCDDDAVSARPGGTEVCDELDNDCDGTTDEDDAVDAPTWYADGDSDGYGDPDTSTESCSQPSGYVDDDSDCDPSDGEQYPGADEYCNDEDDDCDGSVDEDAVDISTWYLDYDGDGEGTADYAVEECEQPSGYVSTDSDCDDTDADQYTGADEYCNGEDDDCDGDVDEDDAVDVKTWYADGDGDGYGDPDTTDAACDQPSGYLANDDDCDDSDASAYDGATEVCDGVDNDCDGDTDFDGWVPSDYSTIQSAIDSASSGDHICIAAGTYTENLDLNGADLILEGEGTSSTIIDGSGSRILDFDGNEDITFRRLTFRDASHRYGALAYLDSSNIDLTLDQVRVTDLSCSTSYSYCYGLLAYGYYGNDLTLTDVEVDDLDTNGVSNVYGALVRMESGSVEVDGLDVHDNLFDSDFYGLFHSYGASYDFADVEIYDNSFEPDDHFYGLLFYSTIDPFMGGGGGTSLDEVSIYSNDIEFTSSSGGYLYGGLLGYQEYHGWGGGSGGSITGDLVSVVGNTVDNARDVYGGVLRTYETDVELTNLVVAGNEFTETTYGTTTYWRGLFYGYYGDWVITNADIAYNDADTSWDYHYGTVFYMDYYGDLEAVNTNVVGNTGGGSTAYAGVYYSPRSTSDSDLDWSYSNYYDNSPTSYDFYWSDSTSAPSGSYSEDPVYSDLSSGTPTDWDLTLDSTSGLVDGGDPSILDADGTTSDVGAYGGPAGEDW